MKLKTHEKEAVELIQKIWNDDVTNGQFSYLSKDEYDGFSMFSYTNEVEDPQKSMYENDYKFSSYKSIFLLKSSGLIDNLVANRKLLIRSSFFEALEEEASKLSPEEAEELGSGLNDDQREQLLDYYRFRNLKNNFPEEEINDCYRFVVTQKCKTTDYDDLENIIITTVKRSIDTILGEFHGLELRKSGAITYKKAERASISPSSRQYGLLKTLISSQNINMAMPINEILIKLGKPSEGNLNLLLPIKTYENLNQLFKKAEIPVRIRKTGDGYMLEDNI